MLTLLTTAVPAAAPASVDTHIDKLQTLAEQLITWGVDAGGRILAAVLIYIIGRILISFIKRLVNRLLTKRKVEPSIYSFVNSLLGILLNILLAIAVISKLGVETTSFAALLASAGVAVGMALSGNLQNFAGGLIILVLRPFKVGDYIQGQGVDGTVAEIQIFHTILTTVDNKVIYVPNGALSSGVVTNYSQKDVRRVDFSVNMEYGADYEQVRAVIERIIAADPRILKTPSEPFIALSTLADNCVKLTVRTWVKASDYWDVNFDMNRAFYTEFCKAGINFPVPKLTVMQQ